MAEDRYRKLIEAIFFKYYKDGDTTVIFERPDIEEAAATLGIASPKNLGDLLYTYRYRRSLPKRVRTCAPKDKQWTILSKGRSKYAFVAQTVIEFLPNPGMAPIEVPDATPGVIRMYSLTDEQALLAIVRYNRLIDIFTRTTCYSLQNHLRTTVPNLGQLETDEIYIGLDKEGGRYVMPVQAKGGKEKLSTVQIQQDLAMCAAKFPDLKCRPIGAQFLSGDTVVLFEFRETDEGVRIAHEKHYRLTPVQN